MKVLVFDTETTGLPEEKNASILDTFRWPYIVQLSFIYYDSESKTILKSYDSIIKLPDEVNISQESINIHGITNEIMREKGISIRKALKEFNEILKKCDIVVGHNISFDKRVIMVECIRNKISQYFTKGNNRKPEFCTMKNSKDLCKIKMIGKNGEEYYKSPKLCELYEFLFNEQPNNLHNSFVDILLTLRCYFAINYNYDVINDNNIKNLFIHYKI